MTLHAHAHAYVHGPRRLVPDRTAGPTGAPSGSTELLLVEGRAAHLQGLLAAQYPEDPWGPLEAWARSVFPAAAAVAGPPVFRWWVGYATE